MEVIIAVAAVLLLGVQTHRNYLMTKAKPVVVQPAEIDYDALARAMEASWPTVNISNDITIDYDKLAEAISQIKIPAIEVHPNLNPTIVVQPAPIVIEQGATIYPTVPNPTPAYPSGPWWQGPVSNTVPEAQQEFFTISGGEEVPVNRFPKRLNGQGEQTEDLTR